MPDLNVKGNKFQKVIWVTMIRSIWDHRNFIVFRNRQRDGEEIFGITWLRNKISKASNKMKECDKVPINLNELI